MLQGEHSAILLTCIKQPFVIKIFVLSIFEWPLKTGFYYIRSPPCGCCPSKVVILFLLVYCSCYHYMKGFCVCSWFADIVLWVLSAVISLRKRELVALIVFFLL